MSASDASRKFSAVLGPPGQARTVLGVQYRPGLVPSGPSAAPRADDRRLAAIWSGKRPFRSKTVITSYRARSGVCYRSASNSSDP